MVTHRFTAVLAAGLLALMGLAACGSSSKSSSSSATTAASGGVTVPATGGGTPVAISVGETSDTAMFLKAVPDSVKAGKVTFTVTNNGKKDHEVVVLKTDAAYDSLPVGSDNKVSEDASVGETGDPALKPGETRSFTLDMTAGKYVLVCNIEKHYAMGMRAPFTVTP